MWERQKNNEGYPRSECERQRDTEAWGWESFLRYKRPESPHKDFNPTNIFHHMKFTQI
jgi:hypothetical protein